MILDLGQLQYNDAWAIQERVHEEVANGAEERILLVEHPPVITLGRRAGSERNILASPQSLEESGVEIVQSDRGGDVTFHGPGQIVAYPIIRLIDHKLSVGGYVRALEVATVLTLREFGIEAGKDACAIGVWVKRENEVRAAKIAAIGVRVRRGVTLHGLALNVTTDLAYFNLITPCGLEGRPVTTMKKVLGEGCPAMSDVKTVLVEKLQHVFTTPRELLPEPAMVGEGKTDCAI